MRRLLSLLKNRFQTFDLLPEYFSAIVGRWNDVLWGAGVVAVAFVLWWFLGNPPVRTIALYLVAVMFIAGYYVWRADHIRLTPRLEFGEVRPVSTPTVTIGTGRPGPRRIVVQLLVKLLTPDAEVKNATGQLLRVWKWSDNANKWTPTVVDEPLNLLWSTIDKPICTLNTDWRLCIFFVEDIFNRHIEITAETIQLRMSEMFYNADPNDIFKFDIAVRGENCPAIYRSLRVQIGSQWDNPAVAVIPDD